jgi:hypothetical protein
MLQSFHNSLITRISAMAKASKNPSQTRSNQRFEREARALQKNLERRKKQQSLREQQKKETPHGQDKD